MMADCSLLSADIGQKNLLTVYEPLICEHLNQPSRILPHLKTLIPLSTFSPYVTLYCFSLTYRDARVFCGYTGRPQLVPSEKGDINRCFCFITHFAPSSLTCSLFRPPDMVVGRLKAHSHTARRRTMSCGIMWQKPYEYAYTNHRLWCQVTINYQRITK